MSLLFAGGVAVAYAGTVIGLHRLNVRRMRAQAGGFYGGWITDDVVGPFKGEPGTSGW